jgi:hypothetical protein
MESVIACVNVKSVKKQRLIANIAAFLGIYDDAL